MYLNTKTESQIVIGNTIQNRNSKDYIVLAVKNNVALLRGDENYLIAIGFIKTDIGYIWSQGIYFGDDIINAVEKYKEFV